ncbi:hypothetical protein CVT24_006004 [Panaeolus cyanescens]|uniref:SPX domain-containing protein n=1 Tax=Panaeolus cyanescens TaxID=181874 RepID=A0A409YE07_9AGAR|nr:hypothetical protein CVT24_006004 [Panaeolus cyanescens]
MKFAQYLQDTQTPEWKKAYIDYRGLKKRITAIRKAQQGLNIHISSGTTDEDVEQPRPSNERRPSDVDSDDIRSLRNVDRPTSVDYGHHHSMSTDKPTSLSGQNNDELDSDKPLPPRFQRRSSAARRPSFTLPSLRARAKTLSTRLSVGGGAGGSGTGSLAHHPSPLTALPLHELLNHLSPHEVSFFTMLDAQLDKVESFFLAREKEMSARGQLLQIQLKELDEHRKLFLETNANPAGNFVMKLRSLLGLYPTKLIRTETYDSQFLTASNFKPTNSSIRRPVEAHVVHNARADSDAVRRGIEGSSSALNSALAPINTNASDLITSKPRNSGNSTEPDVEDGRWPSCDTGEALAESTVIPQSSASDNGKSQIPTLLSADPDSYLYAKRKLKRAVLEHYRGLEMLHNYRVLNITGFRKALKKFEKVTRIIVQNQYMTEKVEKSAFASDKSIKAMMSTMEEFYAASFARGDKKKATRRLRGGYQRKSHHFSTFRSGIALGLAVPAFIAGFVEVFDEDTRELLPTWDALLFIYGLLFIPTLFSLLIGVNLLVWSRSRINYSFIFGIVFFSPRLLELEVITQLDHREYFEDFLMDWSFLQPRAKHRFLRSEIVYQNHIPMYYFAMVSNLLLRFIWVIYIPQHNDSVKLRTFVVGFLEMLRRWQWNFYRLENEHIGNMDQYRVTREVPLPYVFDDHSSHQGRDDDDDEDGYKMKKR